MIAYLSFGNHKSDGLSQIDILGSAHDRREEADLSRVNPFQNLGIASV